MLSLIAFVRDERFKVNPVMQMTGQPNEMLQGLQTHSLVEENRSHGGHDIHQTQHRGDIRFSNDRK